MSLDTVTFEEKASALSFLTALFVSMVCKSVTLLLWFSLAFLTIGLLSFIFCKAVWSLEDFVWKRQGFWLKDRKWFMRLWDFCEDLGACFCTQCGLIFGALFISFS
jgi:hypothetical protein